MHQLLAAALVAFPLVLPLSSQACDEKGLSGIVEENNLYLPVDNKSPTGLTEQEFNAVLDKVQALYVPVVKAKGGDLVIERKWTDGTVNAYASREGKKWTVSMFGGLARHQTITPDGFTLVACHELGHHLGGAPKNAGFWGMNSWASNEGQADYFGTLKCMREVFAQDDNLAIVAAMDVPAHAKLECEKTFHGAQEQALCQRGAMAGMSLANLFKALRNLRVDLSFTTPDKTVVSKTNDAHPAPQCRLDTYFSGSICGVDKSEQVSNTDETKGVCHVLNGSDRGLRPLCWFKSKG